MYGQGMWGWHETVLRYGLMHEMALVDIRYPVGKEDLGFFFGDIDIKSNLIFNKC